MPMKVDFPPPDPFHLHPQRRLGLPSRALTSGPASLFLRVPKRLMNKDCYAEDFYDPFWRLPSYVVLP